VEHHHRTVKNLKDYCVAYNKKVSLFNQIYNQEYSHMQNGADDAIIFETANERYKNRTGAEFKRFHWWEVVRNQLKWRVRSDAPSTMIAFVSSSEAATEEEVTHPIGRDRGKTTTRKGKGNEASSSQSRSFFSIGGVISTLKKLATSFTRAQM
jgi:hypothetical protein